MGSTSYTQNGAHGKPPKNVQVALEGSKFGCWQRASQTTAPSKVRNSLVFHVKPCALVVTLHHGTVHGPASFFLDALPS